MGNINNDVNKISKGGRNRLWIVISIMCVSSAGGLLFFLLQERTERIKTEQRLSKAEKAKRAVEIELEHTHLELTQVKDEAGLLTIQLDEEKKNYQDVLSEVTKRDAQIKKLEDNLANEKKQRTNLANELAQLRETRDGLEGKLKEAKQSIKKLEAKLGKHTLDEQPEQTGVELGKIVVKQKKDLNGKVLAVNKEFHFVVIDLGKNDGVGVDDEFAVYHGSKEIGRLKVEKVYEAMSTAVILSGSQERNISEDSIIKSL